MSLKFFHVLFLACAIGLCVWFGVWGVRSLARTGSGLHGALGVASFVAAGALAAYGVYFLRKLRGVSYL
jgi:hypothetical protein